MFDFNDFETPVKFYFDDRASFYLQPNNAKIVKLYAKRNQATLNDDYFKISSAQNKEFFSIGAVQSDFASYSAEVISKTVILLDRNRDLYQRNVLTILDLFGTIGGIFGLLTSACGFLIGMISTQIMLSSVLRRLY